MGGGYVGLRNEFGDGNAYEDQNGSRGSSEAEALARQQERRDPCEYRFEREQERRVGGRQDGLGPALNGECCGGGECGSDEESGDKARRELNVRMFDERETDGHEERAKSDLQDRQGLKGDAWRDVAESDAVEGESNGAAESEDVSEVDGRDIREKGR